MNAWLLLIILTLPNGKTVEKPYTLPYSVLTACELDGMDVVKKLAGQLDKHYALAYKCIPVSVQ